MRIGECLGLRWDDLDFEKRIISVNHNITNRPHDDGTCTKHISTPKTRLGYRTIPMIDEVYEAFLMEYEMQKCMGYESETIDDYTNFVFLTYAGYPMEGSCVVFHAHSPAMPYHQHGRANTLGQAVHDKWQLKGRPGEKRKRDFILQVQ